MFPGHGTTVIMSGAGSGEPIMEGGGHMLKRLLSYTRFVVIVPVIGAFLGAVTLMGVTGVAAARTSWEALTGQADGGEVVIHFIEYADVFLLAVVLYIIALGLYELFVDDTLPLPAWLAIHSLEDLKEKLVGVVVVVLGVLFLGRVTEGHSARETLEIGLAIAAVIVALSYFLGKMTGHAKPHTGTGGWEQCDEPAEKNAEKAAG